MVDECPEEEVPRWMLHMDRASSPNGNRARVILEKGDDIVAELSVKLVSCRRRSILTYDLQRFLNRNVTSHGGLSK